MVSIIPCRCPNCNAEIQIDTKREFGFCSYCGTKLYIHDDTVTTHYEIHRKIDDAAIKRAESKDRIENRKLDQAERKSKLKVRLVLAYILVCVILCLLAYVFLQHVPGASGTILLLLAMLFIGFIEIKKKSLSIIMMSVLSRLTIATTVFRGSMILMMHLL